MTSVSIDAADARRLSETSTKSQLKVKRITVDIKVSVDQLEDAFVAAGYDDMEVLGVDNSKQEFLWWTEDLGYNTNGFTLRMNSEGVLCADPAPMPSQTWEDRELSQRD